MHEFTATDVREVYMFDKTETWNGKLQIILGKAAGSYVPLIFAIFMMVCFLQPAQGEASPTKVRVGYFENEIFQEGAEPGSVRKGYAYEYYRKLSNYTGWQYEYVYGGYAELYQMLLEGKIDLLAGLAKTPEREGIIGYPVLAMGSETYNMVKHVDDLGITTSVDTLSGRRIGVLDSAMVGVLRNFLEKNNIAAETVIYSDNQELLDAFDANAIDVVVAESDGTYRRENAELLYPFGSNEYYLCVSGRRPDLLEALNRAQEQLMVEDPHYINSLRVKYYSASITSRALSKEEKAWLREHSSLKVGYLKDYLPYSDTDKDGNVTGVVVELFPKIMQEFGIDDMVFVYSGYDSYDDMIADLNIGTIDVVFPVGGGLFFSEEGGINQSNPVIYSMPELVYTGEYDDNKTAHFAVNEKNRMQYYYVKTHFPDAHITFYPSIDACLDAVLDGSVSCTMLNGMRANKVLKNRSLRGLNLKLLGHRDDRCFGVRIGNEGLLKLLNRGLNIIGKDRVETLAYKYVDGLYKPSFWDIMIDNLWMLAAIVVGVAILAALFLARESAHAKSRMMEKEKARKALEEKNEELARKRTELMASNKKLALAAKEAESANQAKTYFLSTMSHDIRTPMNSILSMNEMVLRECDNENILVYAGYIRASGNTLLGLINDILDFSKMEAGKLDIIPVDYEISSLLNDLVNMTKTRADEKGLKLVLNIDCSMPNYLHGDEIRIKQAVTNILTNAVKYTKHGEVDFNIGYDRIPEEPDSIMLNISVRDTGSGIRKEDMGKLFKAFERIDETNNRNIEGTGLGLTITQRLLQLMGSKLEVKSEYGKGSIFYFSVKQEVVKWDDVGDYEAAFRRSIADRKKYKEKFVAPKAAILVVDDTPMNLTVIRSLLKRTQLQIDTVESGDECIELAAKKRYDIIFLDHMMPHKDGIETLHELKGLANNPNERTPIICLTANAISGMRENYLAAGFDDYLTKPIDPDSLEEMILRYLPEDKLCSEAELPQEAVAEENKENDNDTGTEEDGAIPHFLYRVEGLDVADGLLHCVTPEAYVEVVSVFARACKTNADAIESYWKTGDIENATIKIHSLKSSARIIGAEALGSLAEKMEKAGKARDMTAMEAHMEELLEDYRRIGEELKPLADQE